MATLNEYIELENTVREYLHVRNQHTQHVLQSRRLGTKSLDEQRAWGEQNNALIQETQDLEDKMQQGLKNLHPEPQA